MALVLCASNFAAVSLLQRLLLEVSGILILCLLAPEICRPCMASYDSQNQLIIKESLTADSPSRSAPQLKTAVRDENFNSDQDVPEKFIWPLLSDYVGTGNQLMEYMSAAVVARALNRTLCLTPFHDGPVKHTSGMWRRGRGLDMEDRYDADWLSKFVRVGSVKHCLARCHHKVDDTWFLRGQRRTHDWHFDRNTTDAMWATGKDMKWSFVSWTTIDDVRQAFGSSNLSCIALGGLFPGLRWRGAYLAAAAYLKASRSIAHSASSLQAKMIGLRNKFLAVHWRFEESYCGGRNLGSCFLRCGDGAIVNTGLHPQARLWIEDSHRQCHFHGVRVTKEDVVGAIYDRASARNLSTVYLATDGWIRGFEGSSLIKSVVEMLQAKNMTVVGLWRIKGLPNFANGDFVPGPQDPKLKELFGLQNSSSNEAVNNRLISGVEQELCGQADVFLGSGQSTWSLAVFRARLAQRRARTVLESLKGDFSKEEMQLLDQAVHDQVIRELLSDKHEAGLLCRYHKYYDKVPVNATKETFEDEAPDGWLDLEACEMRIGHKGGQCEFTACA